MKPHDWLADAVTRHIVIRAQSRHCKTIKAEPFYGVTEATAVSILEFIFVGLGYRTRRGEHYDGTQKELDLIADHPVERARDWRIEAKLIWDGIDGRLDRKRFFETNREILKDFDNLRSVDSAWGNRVVVWLAFSKSEFVVTATESTAKMRLGDAIAAVSRIATLSGESFTDLDQHASCEQDWRYFRAYCWTV